MNFMQERYFHHRLICSTAGSLGVRVIGGNQVGIFVSAVQEDSPAALHSIKPGDRILSVNEKSMIGVTREEVPTSYIY